VRDAGTTSPADNVCCGVWVPAYARTTWQEPWLTRRSTDRRRRWWHRKPGAHPVTGRLREPQRIPSDRILQCSN